MAQFEDNRTEEYAHRVSREWEVLVNWWVNTLLYEYAIIWIYRAAGE